MSLPFCQFAYCRPFKTCASLSCPLTKLVYKEKTIHITHTASLQLQLSVHIPSGLVGEPTMGNVIIQDKPANAIMDSGYMVSEGLYSLHLSHLSLHPIFSIDLWALGQNSCQYTWRCSFPPSVETSEPSSQYQPLSACKPVAQASYLLSLVESVCES